MRKYTFFLMTFSLSLSLCAQEVTSPTMASELQRDDKSTVLYLSNVEQGVFPAVKKNHGGYKQFRRLENYMMSRLGADGRLVNTAALNYNAYSSYMQSNLTNTTRGIAHNGHWEFIGPTETNPHPNATAGGIGRVNRFAFHPTDPNIIFASSAGGGLWKTIDQGLHWDPLSDGIPMMNTTGVAVDFVDTDIIYLLSGEGSVGSFWSFNEFSRFSMGVFKTTDGGQVWQPTGLVFDEEATIKTYNLHMSPENRLTLYVCSEDGLYRTQDGGTTWENIKEAQIYELEFKPGQANRIYCVSDTYFYVSDDGGDSWIDSTLIPPVDGESGRMCITTCENSPSLVYLIASPIDTLNPPSDTFPDHRGFFVSINSGSDFALVATRPNLLAAHDGNEFKSQAYYDFAIECNPFDGNQVIVAAIGLWKSIDGGDNWTTDGGINSLYHADVHAVEVNPLDSTLYIGTDGGVYISPDFGETFEFRSGDLAITQYYKMATSPFLTNYTLAGAQDNGVHLRDDVETLHDHVVFGDGMECLFHPTATSLVLSSTQEGRIVISHDTGHTFTQILPSIDRSTGSDTAEWTTPIALDANDQFTIYIGYKPIFKSVDQGESFFATSNDTISGHRLLVNNTSYPGRLYAGDCKNCRDSSITFEMYRSLNYGATWERIDMNPGFPSNSFVTAAVLNPDDSLEIWITCGRYEATHKVYRSMDSGNTWSNATGSLPNVPVNAIAFEDNNGNPSGAVYIATDIGVFYRNDDLVDWIYFSNQLPRVEVTDLDIDYNGGWLRAATYGRGLWESELYTSCQDTIVLNPLNQPIGQSFVHHASQQIFSTALVDGYGSKVVYASEGEIYLTEGFRATIQHGAFFRALMAACEEGGIPIPLQPPGTPPVLIEEKAMHQKKAKPIEKGER